VVITLADLLRLVPVHAPRHGFVPLTHLIDTEVLQRHNHKIIVSDVYQAASGLFAHLGSPGRLHFPNTLQFVD
jgi:hypothetical protein